MGVNWWLTTVLGWIGAGLTVAGYSVGGEVGMVLSGVGAGICGALGTCFPTSVLKVGSVSRLK